VKESEAWGGQERVCFFSFFKALFPASSVAKGEKSPEQEPPGRRQKTERLVPFRPESGGWTNLERHWFMIAVTLTEPPGGALKTTPGSNRADEGAWEILPEAARACWFEDLSLRDIPKVGGKNASLGELTRSAASLGIHVPLGFALPTEAFRWFLEETGLAGEVKGLLASLRPGNLENLQKTGESVRRTILSRPLPAALGSEISSAYLRLCQRVADAAKSAGRHGILPGEGESQALVPVAVRSSATAEDLPEASFAGAQESFLNVVGPEAVVAACHECFASLYTDRAISYRAEHGFAEGSVHLSVGIQQMVDPSRGGSGVLFTLDTETGSQNVVLINAVRGLGEALVQGRVTPDEYLVFKQGLDSAPCPILHRSGGGRPGTRNVNAWADTGPDGADPGGLHAQDLPVPLVLEDALVLQLARWGCAIEEHYSRLSGKATPMDVEWVWAGPGHPAAIVQARPETVHAGRPQACWKRVVLTGHGRELVRGNSIGTSIAHGRVRILRNPSELGQFCRGDILVAERTDPDWEPVMRLAAGIVTERGGRTCHAAIVSRELGVPAIVGAAEATRRLAEGQLVTLSCAAGETGVVYEGRLDFRTEEFPLEEGKPTRTRLQLNISDPEQAFRLARLPTGGVGLLRQEFLLAGEIGIHPMALLRFSTLPTPLRQQIAALTPGSSDKTDFFVSRLAEGVGRIAAAFFPRPVLLRFSDFKSNEYARLVGGTLFEPVEENPMLGFRGASRYCHPETREAFSLECAAVVQVRERMGLHNLRVMVPFCRTPEEGAAVLTEMERNGLRRGSGGLQVWMMCEIPSNILLAAEFCGLFDGFSIGSNDLTQLVLGVDRDSERLSALFDERNPAVKSMIRQFLETARAQGKPVGICGQAPSDYPEFTEFLVGLGIDSISLDADALMGARDSVRKAEAACDAGRI
jgi:pyruvate,water dikinase